LKGAVEREFGETTDDQFRSLIDFVATKLRKNGFEMKQERVLFMANEKTTLAELGM
jgi:hypothetical protein